MDIYIHDGLFFGSLLATAGLVFSAFCVWLTVRIINRRERWAKWTAAATIGMPVLYALSSGPVMWLAFEVDAPDWVFDAFETTYGPLLWLAMWSGDFGQPYLCYFGWWQSQALSTN